MRTSVEMYTVVHSCQQDLFAVLIVEPRNQRRALAPPVGLEWLRQHRGSSGVGVQP